ncbi:MAG TPA: helix-turn-helix transcriptional regulator [Ktedonobacterales bacterium]|nr:helix-turn-helix transcriptional regulator [Ktedonobacterales bacterium]
MGQKTTRGHAAAPGGQGPDGGTLMRLKMELVAAREQPRAQGTLGRLAMAHPTLAPDLTEFAAALVATSGYEDVTPTAATEALAERARTRAFAAVFDAPATAAAEVAGRVVATVRALRRARGLSLSALAQKISVGADVLSALEAGLVRGASIPDRFVRSLSEALAASLEAVRAALEAPPVVRPALQRSRASSDDAVVRDFAEAIELSPAMTDEQKARWLTDA